MNIKNLLLGTAIGDAFGAGVEFQDRDWIRANVDFTKFINVLHNIKVPKEQLIYFTENITLQVAVLPLPNSSIFSHRLNIVLQHCFYIWF